MNLTDKERRRRCEELDNKAGIETTKSVKRKGRPPKTELLTYKEINKKYNISRYKLDNNVKVFKKVPGKRGLPLNYYREEDVLKYLDSLKNGSNNRDDSPVKEKDDKVETVYRILDNFRGTGKAFSFKDLEGLIDFSKGYLSQALKVLLIQGKVKITQVLENSVNGKTTYYPGYSVDGDSILFDEHCENRVNYVNRDDINSIITDFFKEDSINIKGNSSHLFRIGPPIAFEVALVSGRRTYRGLWKKEDIVKLITNTCEKNNNTPSTKTTVKVKKVSKFKRIIKYLYRLIRS